MLLNEEGKQKIIDILRKVNDKLQGKEVKFDDTKEPIIVERRKPVVEEILKHLQDPKATNLNIMIDAETGYGKTYDIGLWSHVTSQGEYHHLVAVPNDFLINQAQKMISSVFAVNINTPKNIEELKNSIKSDKPQTIIITHEMLSKLNAQSFELDGNEKPKLWISVDEADSINKEEVFKSVCALDEKYPTTYLTATPKKRILNRCGKVISPTRSNRRCISNTIETLSVIAKTNKRENFHLSLGINLSVTITTFVFLFPIINTHVTTIIGITSNVWLLSQLINFVYQVVSLLMISLIMLPIWWLVTQITGVKQKELLSRFTANVRSLFEKEKSSSAHEYVEECEETFNYKKLVEIDDLAKSLRWNIQSPIGENALILSDDSDSIINLNFALQGKYNLVYENGKIHTRHEIYDKFKPEGTSYQDYMLQLRESNFIKCVKEAHPNLTKEQINSLKDKVDFSNTADYLKYRVMHSMIDLTLSYLMKCNNIELDKKRISGLDTLVESVKNSSSVIENDAIIKFLMDKGFTKQFAKNKLLPQITNVLRALHDSDDDKRRLIIDNWHLSKELHSLMTVEQGMLFNLNTFCEKNKCIFIGIEKNNLDIDTNKPFFKITYKNTDNKDSGEYKAEYCDYDKQNFDALAKYALTTVIDKSKGRGFDSEYNHVASIFTESCSQFNNPAEVLQNLGRNREHNLNRQPWFFAAAGEKVELFIDKVVKKLKIPPQKFCEKVLFPATDKYNKLIKNKMGTELGERIESYITQNIDPLGNIDTTALKNFSYSLVKEVFEKVHDINDFNIEKTREDLCRILKSAGKYLHSRKDRITSDRELPYIRKISFYLGMKIAKISYYSFVGFDYLIFLANTYNIEKSEDVNAKAYVHIIRNAYSENSIKAKNIADEILKMAKNNEDDFTKNNLYASKENECKNKIISYFKSEQYIDSLSNTISRIQDEHLVTILKATNPSSKTTAQEIKDFVQNLKNSSCEEFKEKYFDENSYTKSELHRVSFSIQKVMQEIVACHGHYYSLNIDQPKLKTSNDIFNITVMHEYTNDRPLNYFALLIIIVRFVFFFIVIPMFVPVLLKFIYLDCYSLPDILPLVTNLTFHALFHKESTFQSFIFEDSIQFDIRKDINDLETLKEKDNIACMNEIADKIISTNLSELYITEQDEPKQELTSCIPAYA